MYYYKFDLLDTSGNPYKVFIKKAKNDELIATFKYVENASEFVSLMNGKEKD